MFIVFALFGQVGLDELTAELVVLQPDGLEHGQQQRRFAG
jgi:hypothetical protein